MFYKLGMDNNVKTLYELVDSPVPTLRRDSAELFVKENIPPIHLALVFYSSKMFPQAYVLIISSAPFCRTKKLTLGVEL